MKKLFAILLFLFAFTVAQAQTDSVPAKIRIILPAEKANWEYFLHVEGRPSVKLTGRENDKAIYIPAKNPKVYIYAETTDHTRRTNPYTIDIKGKPGFIVIKGTNGILIDGQTMKMKHYVRLRSELPEADRQPWVM